MARAAIASIASILALFLAVGAWLLIGSQQRDGEQLALGERVYAENCASCHGANLEGEPNWQTRDEDGFLPAPPHDETGHTWHHAPDQLFAIIKYGIAKAAGLEDYQSRMPAFEGLLTDEEIWAVLGYIEAQWPEDIRAMRRERSDQ